MEQEPPVGQNLLVIEASRSYWDTPLPVGLLWTSDQPVAETSTWPHTTFRGNKTSILQARLESANPASQRPQTHVLRSRGYLDRPKTWLEYTLFLQQTAYGCITEHIKQLTIKAINVVIITITIIIIIIYTLVWNVSILAIFSRAYQILISLRKSSSNALYKLTPLYSHCNAATCFSPQGAIPRECRYILWAGSTKYVSRCKYPEVM